MNQGIAVSRTLRALDADDFRASKLGLLMAALLLAAWIWWIFAACVPQYESTTNVRIENGRVVAYFPTTGNIAVGQPVLAHANGAIIPAQVQSVAPDRVELALPPNSPSQIPTSIEIEVSRASPAAIAFQTLTRGNR